MIENDAKLTSTFIMKIQELICKLFVIVFKYLYIEQELNENFREDMRNAIIHRII